MKTPALSVIFTMVLLLCTATRAAAAEQVFEVTGVIRGRLDDGQLIIQHDEIAGYMPAMTMAFALSVPAEAANLRNGDRVKFRFRVGDDASRAEGFVVTGREESVPETKTKSTPTPKARRLRGGDLVPDFSLVDENNAPVTSATWRGRLTVVTFIFTRCPVPEYCPAMAARFGRLQKSIVADPKLAVRARLVSITLDPEFDRPEILKAYGEAVGANPAVWSFATGNQETITTLTKAFAVYNERNGATLDHTLTTALIGPDGRVFELWRGNGWREQELLDALNRESALGAAPCDVHLQQRDIAHGGGGRS